jgi:hypothetical protein
MRKDGLDPTRLEAELNADQNVVRVLREQGDVPSIRRAVDVRFVGSPAEIERARALTAADGWTEVQTVELEDGAIALDVQCEQTTDEEALRDLTIQALRFETASGARYDGWGTVAQKKRGLFGFKVR